MDDTIRALSECFAQTLSTDGVVRKTAEQNLKTMSTQPGFGLTVLKLVSLDTLPLEIRQSAAVTFKNHVKYRWVAQETDSLTGVQQQPMAEDEKNQVKQLITGLMLSTPPAVRAQVSEALSIISSHDFPAAWPTLLPELVSKLTGGSEPGSVNGVLLTAASIFERYRGQYMTEELNKELEYSQHFITPLVATFKGLRPKIEAAAGNADLLRVLLSSACHASHIFYSLNSPGLTEDFEKTLDTWMDEFHFYLNYSNPLLAESDPDKVSPIDAIKAAVCANINLFMERNEEEFEKYLNTFASDVWQLLVTVGRNTGQDGLAMAAIRFLTVVSKSVHHKLFGSPDVLRQICENVVAPNLALREEDEELFEMNFVEYIRRDTEGSDQDTRRRAACELVKALTEKYPQEVTALFSAYVASLLAQYAADPANNWKAKDTAYYLVTALAVKGRTAEKGATATNQLVSIGDFFAQQVLPDLQSGAVDNLPVLKADALKFLTTFRGQVPKNQCVALFPALVALLGSDSNVVHSYAATAVERLLAMKEGGQPRFIPQDLATSLQPLLERLFAAFVKPDSGENEYVMRCVMRVISFVGPLIAPVAAPALQQLSQLLLNVCKNPTQPGFNHYLFESIAALIKAGTAADAGMLAQMEAAVFPAFQLVLSEDVQEFHPYVFQIFAQLVELRAAPLPDVYMGIFPGLLAPLFWERQGNVPALVRLLQAYLKKAGPQIAAGGHLQAVLGVFQKLVASKAHDHEGFYILAAIVSSLEFSQYQQFMPTVWQLLLQRLQAARTPKYQRHFVVFVGLYIAKHGVDAAQAPINGMQPDLFNMLLHNVWLPSLPQIRGSQETRAVAVASTRLLTECPDLQTPAADEFWGKVLDALLQLLEGRAHEATGDDEDDGGDEEYTGYSAAYARLHNAAAPQQDLLPEVGEPRAYLASALAKYGVSQPGRVHRLVAAHVQQDMQAKLDTYCQAAGVSIA